jgi:two-component system cell cycle sensor histidine kinase PleC
MARANAASASFHSQNLRGFARSLRRPFYHRLLLAEPMLRRAVPVLIIAFIAAVGIGALALITENRRAAIADAEDELSLLVHTVAEGLMRRTGSDASAAKSREALIAALPARATADSRRFYVADQNGRILAAAPSYAHPATLNELLGPAQALTVLAEHAGVMQIALPDGELALATVRTLAPPFGQLAVVQPRDVVLERWRAGAALTVTLVTTTSFVLLILGFAFHWQSTRAQDADSVYELVRTRFDTALNRGRCGLWDWDLARGRIYWSDSMFEILGLEPREELLSFGEVDNLVHPEDRSLYEVATQLADAREGEVDRAFRMRHRNGDWVWLRARAQLVHYEGDDSPHLIGIAIDTTEQHKLAERTATADMRLRTAVETISEAFVLWDAESKLVLCNSKYQQLHGLPDSTVVQGTPMEDVVAASKQRVVRKPLKAEDLAEDGARSFEAQIGDGRWLKISERRLRDGGLVSVGTDITAIKRHEERLMESEKRAMATVADLRRSQQTLEYQAQQLAELAQKYSEEKTRAEQANQAKSDFLANMSHELRTPLNAIIGFSEIMEQGMFGALGSEKYHEYCRDIRESGGYLLEVINDILDMSKIEAGRMRLNMEDVRLDELVAEAMRVMSIKADEKRLQIEAEVAQGLSMRGDRRALKQILLNLLSNSIKFTPEGGRIAVRARLSRNTALLLIEDSGIGIPKPALMKLGRPFEQVESQFTKTHKGSGLGLAIAKSLAELHGGAMRIRSVEGIGTTVIIRLPIAARKLAA